MSTWFARCGFGVREGASGNPTHHMQDMLKKGHTPTHPSPLFLHPLRAHCILLSTPMVREHLCPTPITRANREMLTSAVFWCVQLKEAHRHVHRGLARWID